MAEFTTDGKKLFIDGKEVLRGWESFSGWFWFATEKVEERMVARGSGSVLGDGRVVDDTIWFGLVQGFEEEWGDFSEAEIRSLGPYRVWAIRPMDLPSSGRRERS